MIEHETWLCSSVQNDYLGNLGLLLIWQCLGKYLYDKKDPWSVLTNHKFCQLSLIKKKLYGKPFWEKQIYEENFVGQMTSIRNKTPM